MVTGIEPYVFSWYKWRIEMTNIQVCFAHRHAWYTIVILEEENQSYPSFPQYDMFVSHKYLKVWHMTRAFFRLGSERNQRCLAEDEARAGYYMVII